MANGRTKMTVKAMDALCENHVDWFSASKKHTPSKTIIERGVQLEDDCNPSPTYLMDKIITQPISNRQLSYVTIGNSVLKKAMIGDSVFDGAIIRDSSFVEARISKTKFRAARITGVDFTGSEQRGVNYRNANIRDSVFTGSQLPSISFGSAKINDCVFDGAFLASSNFEEALVRDSSLVGADLSYCNMEKADLRGSNFTGAKLEGTRLAGAIVELVEGLVAFGPIGCVRRMGYAVKHTNGPMVQLGCFWGSKDEAILAITKRYGEFEAGAAYIRMVEAACAAVMLDWDFVGKAVRSLPE